MAVDFGQIFNVVFMCAILGVLIWIGITMKKWYSDPNSRPRWVLSIVNLFSPKSYDVMTGMMPYMTSNISTTLDATSNTANACASNCSMTPACLGFTFAKDTSNCTQISTDFGTIEMIPSPSGNVSTYIQKTVNHPKYGFVSASTDYAWDTTLVSQRLGAATIPTSIPTTMSISCIQNASANCMGFSMNSSNGQTWFVQSTSNSVATANVSSYQLTLLTSSRWSDAGF